MPHRFLALSLVAALSAGCSIPDAKDAAAARQMLVGMKADDLQACAGIPSRTRRLSDGTELLSYEQQNPRSSGLHLQLPTVGDLNIAGGRSYCHALFRIAEGRVIGLNYTGDNDNTFSSEGICAPIVRGCLRNPVPARVPPLTSFPEGGEALSRPTTPPPASPPLDAR